MTEITICGPIEQRAIDQLRRCAEKGDAPRAAACADAHVGYSLNVGGVVGYRDYVSPSGVGYDVGCVDAGTEFLTPTGWKCIADYEDGDEVMQYEPTDGTGAFVRPSEFIVQDCPAFFHLKTKYGIDQMLSPEHRILMWRYVSSRREQAHSVMRADDFVERHNGLKLGTWADFETAFSIATESMASSRDEAIRVQVMVNADAFLDELANGRVKAVVSLKKARKVTRARELLDAAEIPFTETHDVRGYTTFRFTPPFLAKSYLPFWGASHDQLQVIAEECLLWDGSTSPACFYSRNEASADFIQYAFTATGRRAVLRTDIDASDGKADYRVFAYERTRIGMRSHPKRPIEQVLSVDGKSYCFVVPSSFWVMRRNGNVAMTGNCGNMAVRTNIRADDIGDPVGECREALTDRALTNLRSSGARKNEALPRAYSNGRVTSAISRIMDEIAQQIDFGMGVRSGNEAEHPVLEQIGAADFVPQRGLATLARDQLGTVGSGNHYVDLFADEDGWVWIGVHFGSRGFGHKTATGFLNLHKGLTFDGTDRTTGKRRKQTGESMDADPVLFPVNGELGQSYIAAMRLAGDYAYAGREVVVQRVLDILGAEAVDTVHNHHNYTWLEMHGGEKLWVVRKGATPAFPGQRGFVGATMGEPAVILEGADLTSGRTAAMTPEVMLQGNLLYSTVHGAGRLMSRAEAAGKKKWRWMCSSNRCDWVQPPNTPKPKEGCPACGDTRGLVKRPVVEKSGKIDWSAAKADLASKGIELRGAAADEAPGAYKRLDEVLAYHAGTINILHTLTPLGVVMAGADVEDPYKD